jgi:hypothetical protein
VPKSTKIKYLWWWDRYTGVGPCWLKRMTDDRRGPTPLFWSHVALDGRWILEMDERLDYTGGPRLDPECPVTQQAAAA